MLQSGQWKCSDRRGSRVERLWIGNSPSSGCELEVTWKGVTLLQAWCSCRGSGAKGTGLPSRGIWQRRARGSGGEEPTSRWTELRGVPRECPAGLRGDLAPELRGGLTRWGRPRDSPRRPAGRRWAGPAGAGQGLTAGESPRWCQRLARASRGGRYSQTERGARRGVRGCPLCFASHPPQ